MTPKHKNAGLLERLGAGLNMILVAFVTMHAPRKVLSLIRLRRMSSG